MWRKSISATIVRLFLASGLETRTGKHQTLSFDRDTRSFGKQCFKVSHGVYSFASDRETP
jgi:hypothetical protein